MDEIVFRTTPYFERLAKKALPEGVLNAVMAELRANPRKGDVIQGTGGARKIRVSLPGRGKSGGARIIYVYVEVYGVIFFLLVYAKNQQADLTEMQRKTLREAIQEIKEAVDGTE
ncbi:MAG: type II toxin-antitoxin system RelE/ParE family toxin [Thermomicrobiales bacterium]